MGDDDGGCADGGGSQDRAGLEDVDKGTAAGADVTSDAAVGVGVGEADRAEVGEGHQGTVILLKVLHDPLGIDLRKGLRLGGESVANLSTLGSVDDDSNAGGGGSSLDGDGHGIANTERDARKRVPIEGHS